MRDKNVPAKRADFLRIAWRIVTSSAKVLEWNFIRRNQSFIEPFPNLFQNHSESLQPIQKTFYISFDEKRPRINPT